MNNDIETSKIENARNKLRKATFSPKPISGCHHIQTLLDKGENPHPRFIATQIYENSYSMHWFCNDCADQHNIPAPGVFVALEAYCADNLNQLIEYTISADNDENPYHTIICKDNISLIGLADFQKVVEIPSVEDVMTTKYRIPFGITVSNIL